ncbi:MAG: DUF6502 family protein [Pseudomonadota bacterium]
MGNYPIVTEATPLLRALRRVLRPLVGLMMARGLRYPELCELLKAIYIETAERSFGIAGRRMTDSRLSLLTGLQRKDLRQRREAASADPAPGAGPLPRLILAWQTLPAYQHDSGGPRPLPRQGPAPSFESLVAEISRDMHPRTLLDEMMRQNLVATDAQARIGLCATAFLPREEADRLGYLGANLGDHAMAACANLTEPPPGGPFFERAAHFNGLTPAALGELDTLARALQADALAQIAARATALQTRDAGSPEARGRFRAGAFVYHEETPP